MGSSKCTSRPSDSQRHLPYSQTNYVLGEWISTLIATFKVILFSAAVQMHTNAYAVENIWLFNGMYNSK